MRRPCSLLPCLSFALACGGAPSAGSSGVDAEPAGDLGSPSVLADAGLAEDVSETSEPDAAPPDAGLGSDASALPDVGSPAPSDAGGGPERRPPVARPEAEPTSGRVPLTVRFDARASSDPDGDLARYEWRFGGGSPPSDQAVVDHVFTVAGVYAVELEVFDATGLSHVATIQITASDPDPQAGCPTVPAPTVVGTVTSQSLPEISGMVASRSQPGVFWVHNDSGGQPRVYAINEQGTLRAGYQLMGAQAVDWEDIAIGPGPNPGQDYLYLGDIGDNSEQADLAIVYRIPEPTVPASSGGLVQVGGVEAFGFRYANGNTHNAEALLVDPFNGDVIIFTKSASGNSSIYRASPPFVSGQVHDTTLLGVIDFTVPGYPGTGEVTGGDISPTGDVLIRTYYVAYFWPRPPGAGFVATLNGGACATVLQGEPQGEAIAFRPGQRSWYTVSEGANQPIYRYDY